MGFSKEELKESIRLKNAIQVEGLAFDEHIFDGIGVSQKYGERVNVLFTPDRHAHRQVEFPACFYMPVGGYRTQIRWNNNSPYKLVRTDNVFNIINNGQIILEDIKFVERPDYYDKKTSDGADMRTLATDVGYGSLFIVYSNECCLKEKGKDCLLCNINETKSLYADEQNIQWKQAKQIAETIKYTYDLGYRHLTVSGGFVPERREVDIYADIAEAIQDATGLIDFNGTACVGAPNDFSAIEKFKEVGFNSIATNIEVWNERMFDVICPGKSEFCGGRENWLKAIEYEVEVFGKQHVRSTLVSGIEPKESLLEGIEILVEKGVNALPSQWYVNVGSALEGHRTPDPDWHWDVFEKTVSIYRKYGLTYERLRDTTAEPDTVAHDLLRLEQGLAPNQV